MRICEKVLNLISYQKMQIQTTMRYRYTPTQWLKLRKMKMPSIASLYNN